MKESISLPVFEKTKPYTIDWHYYQEGFTVFQKKYVLLRNRIMMLVFAVLLVSFIVSAATDPSNKMAYFLMMLCLAAICMLWYNPRKQKRLILDAVRELEGEQYTASCDGKVLRIQAEAVTEDGAAVPESRVLLENAWVQEMEAFYLVCDGKRMFYILPKAAIAQPAETTQQEDAPEADRKSTRLNSSHTDISRMPSSA